MTEPAPVSLYRAPLDGITLAEALARAISFEASAHRSYCDPATPVCPQNWELIEELATEELSHRKLLEQTADDPDLAELAPEGPVQDLFRFLREEGDRRAQRIGARWSASSSIL